MAHKPPAAFEGHSLSIAAGGVVLFRTALYLRAQPDSHAGSFYGNAIADWTGTVLIVLATKRLYEVGSLESNKPPQDKRTGACPLVSTR